MRIATGLFLAALMAAPAYAQASAPAPAPAASAAAPATSNLTIDTPIETLLADPVGKAVLDKTLPDLDKHPSYEMFKSMSVKDLQPLSSGQITEEEVAKVEADLKAAKPAGK